MICKDSILWACPNLWCSFLKTLFSRTRLTKNMKKWQLFVLSIGFNLLFYFRDRWLESTKQHCSYQNALVDVSIADGLHADSDYTRVSTLFVVKGQRGRRGAAGQRGLWAQGHRGRAEVRLGRAAGGAGEAGRGGGRRGGGEILCDIAEWARERLTEGNRERGETIWKQWKPLIGVKLIDTEVDIKSPKWKL